MRISILYTSPGSYTRSCLKSLIDIHGASIRAIVYKPSTNAPFKEPILKGVADYKYREQFPSSTEIANWLLDFKPDCVLVSGWSDKEYLKAAKIIRKKGILVIGMMDTQFRGSFRQKLAIRLSPLYLKTAFDALWVPGERQAMFARRLGFRGFNCWSGLYACDIDKFQSKAINDRRFEKAFLFLGRYIERKGIDVLLKAYSLYRNQVEYPWELHCAGAGKLEYKLKSEPGVKNLGFIQPTKLPQLIREFGAFVLPSRFEAWGVVIQEAAASGLPLICSDAVGASSHLIREHYNGYIFESENASELATCLKLMSDLTNEDRIKMGNNSIQLSNQYSPSIWADIFVKQLGIIKKQRNIINDQFS